MNSNLSPDGTVALTHLGLIRARGEEASAFLHGQLTNDFSTLGLSEARLAGFCSAKGRLQASFVAWKAAPGDVLLLCAASVLPATLKRLSMFVLRSKCKLSDASAEFRVWGVAGSSAMALIDGVPVWARRDVGRASVIRLPDAADQPRCLWVASRSSAQGDEMPRPLGPDLSLDAWRWLEVQSGVPIIEAATADQFVPQMLNFELLGGVDFKKGCYPGQEVVARSQYRGTVKRRMFLFDSDAIGSAGQEVFHEGDPGQPAGMVANAATRPDGAGSSLLVEVKLAALTGGGLRLGSPQGAELRRTPLPYGVPVETT